MKRADGRWPSQLRKINIVKNYQKNADGSCMLTAGKTQVLCAATVEENVPPFLKNSGMGWVTAEYGMLPCSCNTRIRRNNQSGRTFEIQRLIGRSLRSVVDMGQLGERTIRIDCDVIHADGGTRTASITGGFMALVLALNHLKRKKILSGIPVMDYVAAISVGLVNGQVMLDLNYEEDSGADMDMNVVMLGKGAFVEIQGTAERSPFTRTQNDALLRLASKGIKQLVRMQKEQLKGISFYKGKGRS